MNSSSNEFGKNQANPPGSDARHDEVNLSGERVVNPAGGSVNSDSSRAPLVDRAVIREYLDAVYGGVPGLLQIWCMPAKGRGRFFTTDPDGLSDAVTWIANAQEISGQQSVYARMTTLTQQPAQDKHSRGGADLSSHFIGFWTDLDFGTVGHKPGTKKDALPLPADAGEAQRVYTETGLPDPSIIVNSGGGLYHLVLLDEPLDISDPVIRGKVADMSRRWQRRVGITSEELGYSYGAGVFDLARVLRVPGTVNLKDWSNPRSTYALHTGARYTLEQLEALVPEPPAPVRNEGGQLINPATGEILHEIRASGRPTDGTLRPGDDFNDRADWRQDVLLPSGWQYSHNVGTTEYWTRPGKDVRDGHSASLNWVPDRLWVWSAGDSGLQEQRAYDKFSAHVIMAYGGDFTGAARDLAARGFGTQHTGPTTSRQMEDMWAGQLNDDGSVPEGTPLAEAVAEAVAPLADWSGAFVNNEGTTLGRPERKTSKTPDAVETVEIETREAFAERMAGIDDAGVRKNEARKRVKQLAAKGTNEEERQAERDFLKQTTKLSVGDFKALYAAAARSAAQEAATGSDDRPVYAMGDELREYTGLVDLIENRAFPETYVRDGKLVHVEPVSGVRAAKNKISTATYQAKDLTPAALRRLVATYTTPLRVTERGADSPLPTRALCESVLDNPDWAGVDTLNGLTDAPFIRGDGSICQDHGYDEATGMWLALPPGYRPVPDNPSMDEVRGARDLILNQVLRDFPFASTADRANAVGMLLTPMIRAITSCPVPLHVISAHTPGTGKTLLAKIAIAAHGGDSYTFPRNSDEEFRKQATAILMDQASPVVNFDNIATGSTIESPALAALLTADVWRDRLLGGNTTVALPNDKLWIATGNNLKVNTDLSQRTMLVQLDAGTERPDLRPTEEFELGDLEQWLLKAENRATLVRALLILIRDWSAAGMPKGDQTMRSFTPWAQAIGGLLAHHGINDFLGNQDVVVEADEDKQQDALFLQKWTEIIGDQWISTSDLLTKYQTDEQARYNMYGSIGYDTWQGAFPLRANGKPFSAFGLGKWLGVRKDTPSHGYVLRRRTDPVTNRAEWRAERLESSRPDIPRQQDFFESHLT